MDRTHRYAFELLYGNPPPSRFEALLPRLAYRLERAERWNAWWALGSVGLGALAYWEQSYAITAICGLSLFVFGRDYLKAARPLTPRPFEHEWIRFLRSMPTDPDVRKLIATEFINLRKDEQGASILAEKWYAE